MTVVIGLFDSENIADDIAHAFGDEYDDGPTTEDIKAQLDGAEILVASYMNEGYSGSAFVLYRKDGKLYEVNGSHCSCYGLEGQWGPEETTATVLKMRGWRDDEDGQQIADVIDALPDEDAP